MTRRTVRAAFLYAALLIPAASCNTIDLGGLAALFAPGVTVVFENNTDFTAVPDLRTSDSRNLAEDTAAARSEPGQSWPGLTGSDRVITAPALNFGANGSVGPHQTVTLRLTCNGDLERLVFRGADFREGNGFALGDVNSNVTLRRDTNFDCGDTIRITLSGSIFRFRAEVNVDRSSSSDSGVGGSQDGNNGNSRGDDDEDTADWLDDLFD